MLKVLLTGSCGRIGRVFVPAFQQRYQLRTMDRQEDTVSTDHVCGDLQDAEALARAMQGIEVLVHLAAQPDEADFAEHLVPNNVLGCQACFEASREAGVRRIVFASTCQTVLQYPAGQTVGIADPVRPSTLYGATKVFGEVMGRWYHDKHDMEFVAIRIGAFQAWDSTILHRLRESRPFRRLWLSSGDAINGFQRAIEREGLGYLRIFLTSKTPEEYLDLTDAREHLGYEPKDAVEEHFGVLPAEE